MKRAPGESAKGHAKEADRTHVQRKPATHSLRAPFVAEMIGTALIVFVGGLANLSPGAGPLAPIAMTAALIALVSAMAGVSGAHFNPAVSLAAVVAGRLPLSRIVPYWAAQLAGTSVAAASVLALKETAPVPMSPGTGGAFSVELVFTCALAFVYLSLSPNPPRGNTLPLGIGVGSVALAGSLSAAPLSGGLFNPALASAMTVWGLLPGSALWIYWVSAAVAAPLSVAIFHALHRPSRTDHRR